MGWLSKSEGDTYEGLVDLSLRRYENDEKLTWSPTYPKTRIIGRDHRGKPIVKIVGKACPDRRVILAPAGQLLWLEIKKFSRKNSFSYTFKDHPDRKNQYEILKNDARVGALSFYLVCWVYNGREDWRLHNINTLFLNERSQNDGIFFDRESGIACDASAGYPDWLRSLRKCQTRAKTTDVVEFHKCTHLTFP